MENRRGSIMHPETKEIIRQEYSPKTTFRGKFEVAWKFSGPHIIENYGEIVKTAGESRFWRRIGNTKYTTAEDKDYLRKSIEAYTKSIASAPVGSSELSLAYGNRSAVLFRARLYEDCLLDIERALTSGYPDNLKTKLYVRQALCFRTLKPNSELEPSISIANANLWLPFLKAGKNQTYDIAKQYTKKIKEPREIIKLIPEIKKGNAIIVGASDAIELKQTNENNQHVVATRDINSGEFIYISEPFAATPSVNLRFTNCWHCCRQTWAGIPCHNCSAIIYCSDTCKKTAWDSYHYTECLVLGEFFQHTELSIAYILPVKLFFKTLNLAGGLLELKKKVDDIDSMQNTGLIFTNGILDVNTIDNFFTRDNFNATPNECLYGHALFVVKIVAIFGQKTDILGKIMTKEELLNHKNEKLLILAELLLRFLLNDSRHGQSLFVDDSVKWSQVMLPFWKISKPSCDPNVDWTHVGSNVGYYAVKPIKQGEMILWSATGSYHMTSKFNRNLRLGVTSIDQIQCKCEACVGDWSTVKDLPSYERIAFLLSTSISAELTCMTDKFKEFKKLIKQGDPKKLITIKDELSRMNDMIHQFITVPCKEISELYLSLKTLYNRLHCVHDIDD